MSLTCRCVSASVVPASFRICLASRSLVSGAVGKQAPVAAAKTAGAS